MQRSSGHFETKESGCLLRYCAPELAHRCIELSNARSPRIGRPANRERVAERGRTRCAVVCASDAMRCDGS